MYDVQTTDVYYDKLALEDDYQDILSGIVNQLDPLPLVGK